MSSWKTALDPHTMNPGFVSAFSYYDLSGGNGFVVNFSFNAMNGQWGNLITYRMMITSQTKTDGTMFHYEMYSL